MRLMGLAIVLDLISSAICIALAGLGVVAALPILRDHWPKGNPWGKGAFDAFMNALPPSTMLSAWMIVAVLIFIGGIVLIPVTVAPWADVYRRLAYRSHYAVFD